MFYQGWLFSLRWYFDLCRHLSYPPLLAGTSSATLSAFRHLLLLFATSCVLVASTSSHFPSPHCSTGLSAMAQTCCPFPMTYIGKKRSNLRTSSLPSQCTLLVPLHSPYSDSSFVRRQIPSQGTKRSFPSSLKTIPAIFSSFCFHVGS